jgi:hypothetical protein
VLSCAITHDPLLECCRICYSVGTDSYSCENGLARFCVRKNWFHQESKHLPSIIFLLHRLTCSDTVGNLLDCSCNMDILFKKHFFFRSPHFEISMFKLFFCYLKCCLFCFVTYMSISGKVTSEIFSPWSECVKAF